MLHDVEVRRSHHRISPPRRRLQLLQTRVLATHLPRQRVCVLPQQQKPSGQADEVRVGRQPSHAVCAVLQLRCVWAAPLYAAVVLVVCVALSERMGVDCCRIRDTENGETRRQVTLDRIVRSTTC